LVPVIAILMAISLLVISSMTGEEGFWTPMVKSQLKWCLLGWAVFALSASFDYRLLRNWSLPLYLGMVVLLAGLFFVPAIQNVHRWYRVPGLGLTIQPSEHAKLILVMAIAWFLEKRGTRVGSFSTALEMGMMVGIPFFLILKEPDLGTALILYPIALGVGYLAGVRRSVIGFLGGSGLLALVVAGLIFSGVVSHEEMRPTFTKVMKEYQYERLNPNTYHQRAAQVAISIGGLTGTGWRKSEFSGKKWLPAAHTDSVFAAFGEEFGLIGVLFLLSVYYALIYFSFQATQVAKDPFGRYLAAGISIYLAMHVLVNIAMMCGLLPISGVPLIFITYGGNSLVITMAALGLLQSVYSRRFMF
jgi:rod shape determining protein RodA